MLLLDRPAQRVKMSLHSQSLWVWECSITMVVATRLKPVWWVVLVSRLNSLPGGGRWSLVWSIPHTRHAYCEQSLHQRHTLVASTVTPRACARFYCVWFCVHHITSNITSATKFRTWLIQTGKWRKCIHMLTRLLMLLNCCKILQNSKNVYPAQQKRLVIFCLFGIMLRTTSSNMFVTTLGVTDWTGPIV